MAVYSKKVLISLAGIGLLAGGILGTLFAKKGGDQASLVAVSRSSVSEVVTLTGQVKALEEVELAFEKTGKVAAIRTVVGKRVAAGEELVRQDSEETYAGFLEAKASLKAAEAKFSELRRGTRLEEIAVEEVKVRNGETALQDSKQALVESVRDAYSKADDAVRNKADQFFSNPRSANPELNFFVYNPELKNSLINGRVILEKKLSDFEAPLPTLTVSNITSMIFLSKETLSLIGFFLNDLSRVVNALSPSPTVSQNTIDGWKADIAAARTNVGTASSNLLSAESAVRGEESALTLAKQQLALSLAGSSPEEIAAEEAAVEQASAKVFNYEVQFAKMTIRAPLAGVVTKIGPHVGEITPAGEIVVTIMSEGAYEIEANVPEVDIGRVKVGDIVSITIDAYSGEIFGGVVALVDPAETIIDGVVNFKVTIRFIGETRPMKSGLTANVQIKTAEKQNVLTLPDVAIIENDEGTFVKQIINGKEVEVPVTLGLRGAEGKVEITAGLKEGDQVLLVGLKTK
ncbi:MAG: hypothetical protein A2836_03860 [Candidatus Taylorbacteria bacterium RIFCSPHIGHO2_01_FULL_45_63]|uniref:Membrane fusion protein biotin-lipoyl like domain-containing protein n=1 Tax=Candidatus Taylorbacteria bacterium RIFCSPHIGHO2_02_FULL_45_35 TaxID=1802311 RepID=A0A1G2MPL6_9BACT|nr:MAG: hypothetical protein A2836_03860 [Candidatus Taylorbacteria bacterium RIFCSPHIGHO2_01_FULL_45_63]OHA25806.1 MAG: hypothetical protein A3D56_00940 [Candidatus Taylorbacteria bacterium RIFCSPHIGHO2_02_FULL_45_35]OHA34361.1 MAG: hypothetical protein A3A22_00560 [Candidatus Taylorbacteria bacterium RIFCSPLOWO2_01_FULL_45_34b]